MDKDSGLVHTVEATPANVHDVTQTSSLLTGEEDVVYGDSGYLGAGNREDAIVRNKSGRKIKYKINRRPSQLKKLSKSGQYAAKKAEHAKSSVRAKVEHVFGVVKKQLQFRKTRYRGSKSSEPNSISCSHWRICFWLTGPPGGLKLCALAKKCAGKPMVSCLMGDSTALASAIVRCCLKKNSGWNIAFQRYFGCGVFVVRSRRLTKHLHRLAIFLFVKPHGYIECIQKFFSGSRFVKQRIISNQAVSFQRIGVKGFNSILRQQSIIVAKIL